MLGVWVTCMSASSVCGAYGGQKRSDLLELELQIVVSHHARNQTMILCKSNKFSTSSPIINLLFN